MVQLMKRLYYIILLAILWGCSSDVVELPEEVVNDIVEISVPEITEPIIVELEEDPIMFYSTRASTDICKITDGLADSHNPLGIGVDLKEHSIPSSGIIRVAVVYLDFADYRWNRNESTYELTSFLIEPIQEYYNEMSGGLVQFEWVFFDEIVSLPRKAKEYNITRGSDSSRISIRDAVSPILERQLNVNDWDVILWGINPDVPESISDFSSTSLLGGPNNQYFYHMAIIGIDTRRTGYVNMAHEFGHMFGLPDLYVNVCYNNEMCQNGTVDWRLQFQYAGAWSIMAHANHANNELTGWERFILRWLDDNDFHCIVAEEEHIINLHPLNSQNGTRVIGINISDDKNLIIELREQALYCRTCDTGLLIYTVNSQATQEDGFIHIIKPSHSTDIFLEDALLLPIMGLNTLEYNGWQIELITLNENGAAVRIIKLNSVN